MSEEAPKTIFLSDDIPRLLFFEEDKEFGEAGFVEYIRKDEYDELQTKYDNLDVDCHRFHVAKQARIKELEEEALEKIILARSYSVLSAFEIARNAPAKEST
jgi:hypothetical protein